MNKLPRGLLSIMALILFLSGCAGPSAGLPGSGTVLDYIEEQYQLVDVVKSSTNQEDLSKIYRAENRSVDEVKQELINQKTPVEVSDRKDDKQVLVYDNYFVMVAADEQQSDVTLIEAAEYGFVRDNFQPDFFDGMLALWFLDEVLDVDDWGKRQKNRCVGSAFGCYGGYTVTGGKYKGPVTPPSFRGSSVRGGGPGTGK